VTANGLRKLIGVVRVSTEDQAKDGKQGIERQVTTVRAVARREGVPLEIFQLVDVSGSEVSRTPEWKEILAKLDVPGTHLAADAIDRICRASELDLTVLADLQRRGTKLYTSDGVRDFGVATDRMLSGILALVGGLEKSEIKRRMNEGKERKRARGEHMNGVKLPFAVAYDQTTKIWSYTPEADQVKHAYELILHGASIKEVGRFLGKNMSSVGLILRNPIYRGIREYTLKRSQYEKYSRADGRQGEAKKVLRDEPLAVRVFKEEDQLIPDHVWYDAQRALEARKNVRPAENPYWVSGILHSADSGQLTPGIAGKPGPHRLYGKYRSDKAVRYICRCSNVSEHMEKCRGVMPKVEKVHAALDRLFLSLDFVGQAVEDVKVEGGGNDLHDQILRLRSQEDRLLDLYQDGEIDKVSYLERRDNVRKELGRLQSLSSRNEAPDQARVLEWAKSWVWNPEWTPAEKREHLLEYVPVISISRKGIEALTLRLPAKDGGTVWYTVQLEGATWEALS